MDLIEKADNEPLTGTVEADETYIGGKYDKRCKRDRYDKPPVFGVIQRDGKARTCHMPNVSMKGIIQIINAKSLPRDRGSISWKCRVSTHNVLW